MNSGNIAIVSASEDDSRDIWNWRNDPLSRSMSGDTAEIDWESHSGWYANTLKNPNRSLYIGCLAAGDRIGMCRFDIDDTTRTAQVSINLNPAMRGKKLSSALLKEAMRTFLQTRTMPLTATVKKQNEASVKCFEASGFTLDRQDDKNYYYTYN